MISTYDAEKLRQILSNLLSNALKFTPLRGNIYVSITASVRENVENDKWLITGVRIKNNTRRPKSPCRG